MTEREPIRLIPIAKETRLNLGEQTWRKHPDGRGGYQPIDPTKRGELAIACPHRGCGAPLVRDGTEALVRTSVFRCEVCHRFVAGPDVLIPSDETP